MSATHVSHEESQGDDTFSTTTLNSSYSGDVVLGEGVNAVTRLMRDRVGAASIGGNSTDSVTRNCPCVALLADVCVPSTIDSDTPS